MKLPGLKAAAVPKEKITSYLLSFTHRSGRSKAEFFSRFGFTTEDWHTLVDALIRHAEAHEVSNIENSVFGVKYIVEGTLDSPDGRNPTVQAVWFIAEGETAPRLVTAYPCLGRPHDERT